MNDIRWNRISLAEFRSLACLTAEEDEVLKDWARGDIDIRATADRLHKRAIAQAEKVGVLQALHNK